MKAFRVHRGVSFTIVRYRIQLYIIFFIFNKIYESFDIKTEKIKDIWRLYE